MIVTNRFGSRVSDEITLTVENPPTPPGDWVPPIFDPFAPFVTTFAPVPLVGPFTRWLYRRFFAQQFKRSCLPDGPKVGSVALSPRGDWRIPSDAQPTLWLQDLAALQQALGVSE